MLLPVSVTLGVVLAVLLVFAAAVAAWASLGRSREILVAGVRAAAQLAAVSLLIGWVVRSVAPLLGFVALMFAVAVWTAGRRITANRTWRWAAVPIGAGVLPVVGALLLTGLVPVRGMALIPVAGILIGGALTATVLSGRRALDELAARRGEVEAGMAPGRVRRIMTGSTASGTAPRRVAETPESLRDEDVPAPCDAPHQTPRPIRP
ncbi:ABC transporter permease [Streptomyces rubiginosohelvolus]|uniref:ABC transporter permease n=1 Tax=Streptomyces rubiginosohelvolus TaxID=67362 RepID=UPI00369BF2D0